MEAPKADSNIGRVTSPVVTHATRQQVLRIIEDPKECIMLYQQLASSVKTEALLLLPNGFKLTSAQKLGIIDSLIEASEKRAADVRILCPIDESDNSLVRSIQNPANRVTVQTYQKYCFGSIFFIVNSNESIRTELISPDSQEFESAVGISVYSSSKLSVDSFKTFFEVLWNQTSLSEEFRKRERMKDEFIAVASHELRTPIQPIIGFAYLAVKGKVSQEEAWTSVLKEARRLQQLANDILDVSKLESGNMIYFKEYEKINQLLLSIVNSTRNNLPAKVQINLEFDEAEKELEVWMDRSRIAQVITNLVGNAVKFTEQGEIKIQCRALRNESKIEIRVSDTGKGISDEIMPLLFQKFATRGHGNVQNHQGTGLGLYISKAIVEGHGGEILAFNNADTGATFVITLPISPSITSHKS